MSYLIQERARTTTVAPTYNAHAIISIPALLHDLSDYTDEELRSLYYSNVMELFTEMFERFKHLERPLTAHERDELKVVFDGVLHAHDAQYGKEE